MAGGLAGGHGHIYEYRMCMFLLVRGYIKGLNNFEMRYQRQKSQAEKFDDIVFDTGEGICQYIQLKHNEKKRQTKISGAQLFNEKFNTDYNLLKYVKSVKDINSKADSKGIVRKGVVFTNIDFALQKGSSQLSLISNCKDWCKGFKHIKLDSFTPDENYAIVDTSNLFPDAKYYKLDNDKNIIHILKRQSQTFSNELPLSNEWKWLTWLRHIFNRFLALFNYENQQKMLREKDEALAKDLKGLGEADIREALKHIVYAVRQPNAKELEEIIKNEIKDYFKLQDVDTVYNALANAMTKWCNTKDPFDGQICDDPHIIQFNNADEFFQKHVKIFSFGVISSTNSFVGRTDELNLIRKKIKEKPDLIISQIVSQSVKISGLGGIGKTELTKEFIKRFGQSDFYGRVIWIEAESDESVKKSFKLLAEKIDIKNWEKKSTKAIIDDIFDYFDGVKVLFVFDNFDYNPDDAVTHSAENEEKPLVIYCQKKASDPTKKHRPYFIFTSRNRECLPGVSSLDLRVLTKEDANELIKKGLNSKNYTNEDVDELAKKLQYFPLALQQAIAFINRQDEIKSVSGEGYVIQNYLTEFDEKTKELLNYPHTNDFGKFERTTWITWNVTFDAITKEKTNGENAIKILRFMSYLYADKIDAKMFLSLFECDSTRNGEAFLLLEKYSMITKIEKIGKSNCYQIHRLVQAVVQLKFKKKESDILEQVWKLIFPELYAIYFTVPRHYNRLHEFMSKCTMDQILHYNSLAIYNSNYEELKRKFQDFIVYLNERVFLEAYQQDDVDKIKELQFLQEALKKFAKRSINFSITFYPEKVVEYFFEIGYLELNGEILVETLENGNFYMLKLLVEKGINLGDILFGTTDLIREVIQGESNLLLAYIEHKEKEENVRILKESLFFASLFNQEAIVELLINNNVESDYEFHGELAHYAPIKAAFQLNYPHILKIILKAINISKPEVKDKIATILSDFFDFIPRLMNIECFKIMFNKYLELGGNINDKFNEYTLLNLATIPFILEVESIKMVNFLLENGADPFLMDRQGYNALFNVLRTIKHPRYHRDIIDIKPFNDIYSKMRGKISTEEFMSYIFKHLKIKFANYYKNSDDLYQYTKNINFRNEKGETLLIFVLRLLYENKIINRLLITAGVDENTIILLLEAGVDINAKDNDGKDALYYALHLESEDVFVFLLRKVSSVSDEILIKAITYDKSDLVEELLKTHFELNPTLSKKILEVALENLSFKTMFLLRGKIDKVSFTTEESEKICKIIQNAWTKYMADPEGWQKGGPFPRNLLCDIMEISNKISTELSSISPVV